jgi:subtilisin-like proprotein convertase family protein
MRTSTTQTLKPRGVMATLMFLLAAVLAVTMIAMTVGAREASAGKPAAGTTTYSNQTWITINDNATATPYPSTIRVGSGTGVRGSITEVNVTFQGFQHGWTNDVYAYLVGPHGQQAILMNYTGGAGTNGSITLTFDDEATSALSTTGNLATGSYQPSGYTADNTKGLNVFDGTRARGNWKLYVRDDSGGGDGAIQGGWQLDITTA